MVIESKKIHYVIFILAIGAVIIGMLLLHVRVPTVSLPIQQRSAELITAQHAVGVLRSGSLEIPVSIADTPTTRDQGLSDTPSLPAADGKLFVFDQPSNYGFWMKDMNYSLDFVWMDSVMNIIAITPNVAASTYPQIFYPPQPVQYVLEVNAGFSTAHRLTVGQQLTLH